MRGFDGILTPTLTYLINEQDGIDESGAKKKSITWEKVIITWINASTGAKTQKNSISEAACLLDTWEYI